MRGRSNAKVNLVACETITEMMKMVLFNLWFCYVESLDVVFCTENELGSDHAACFSQAGHHV